MISSLASFDNIRDGVSTLTAVSEPHEHAIPVTGMLGLLIVIRRTRASRS